mmetsp:Transcript_8384/g.16450  ORF Transcript_8384/g.16450 Transcript_8384/m.16450 type:complete len:210 (+) Transcript_8384:567-1196(+)
MGTHADQQPSLQAHRQGKRNTSAGPARRPDGPRGETEDNLEVRREYRCPDGVCPRGLSGRRRDPVPLRQEVGQEVSPLLRLHSGRDFDGSVRPPERRRICDVRAPGLPRGEGETEAGERGVRVQEVQRRHGLHPREHARGPVVHAAALRERRGRDDRPAEADVQGLQLSGDSDPADVHPERGRGASHAVEHDERTAFALQRRDEEPSWG